MIKESENRKNLKLQMITFSWQRFIHMHKFDKFFKLSSGQKRCGPPKIGEKHIDHLRSGD